MLVLLVMRMSSVQTRRGRWGRRHVPSVASMSPMTAPMPTVSTLSSMSVSMPTNRDAIAVEAAELHAQILDLASKVEVFGFKFADAHMGGGHRRNLFRREVERSLKLCDGLLEL